MLKARQVPFDEQQAPDLEYEDLIYIAIDGNPSYKSLCCDEYEQAKNFLSKCLSYAYNDDKIQEIVNDYLSCRDTIPLDKSIEMWKILISYDKLAIPLSEAIVRILTTWTDCPWDVTSIKGSCQGEWQNVWYDTSCYSLEDIKRVEAAYFNTGTQWEVMDEDEYYTIYCYKDNEDELKKEIADNIGKKVSEISFEKFEDYKKVPVYKEF